MKLAIIAAVVVLSFAASAADAPLTLDLWASKPPGFQVEGGPERDTSKAGEKLVASKPVIRTGFVSTPQIVVYAAPKDKANGTAVVVCPGGGFNILAWDLEGTEVATWLNSIGVTAAVLKYRVPTASLKEKKWEPPVQDCQRALSWVRSKAADWNVNPERVGVLGFSAGGTTAGFCAMKLGERLYDAKDDADKQPCHANFAVLIYPYLLWDAKTSGFPEVVKVSEKMPPVFFAHANDDKLVMDSLQFFLLLKNAKVKGCEMHIYDSGGHGFGLRTADLCSTWPKRCEEWMNKQGWLTKPVTGPGPDFKFNGLYMRTPRFEMVETLDFHGDHVRLKGDPTGGDPKKFDSDIDAEFEIKNGMLELKLGNGGLGEGIIFVNGKLAQLGMAPILKADAFPRNHTIEKVFSGTTLTSGEPIKTTLELKKDGHYSLSRGSIESGTYSLSENTLIFTASSGEKSTHTVIPYPERAAEDVLIFDNLVLRKKE